MEGELGMTCPRLDARVSHYGLAFECPGSVVEDQPQPEQETMDFWHLLQLLKLPLHRFWRMLAHLPLLEGEWGKLVPTKLQGEALVEHQNLEDAKQSSAVR